MARWIHEFRSTGERALTDGERTQLGHRARVFGLRRVALAVLAALVLPFGIVVGIVIAADPNPLGWVVMAGSFVPFCYLLSWSNGADKLALLHRRALRLGTVEEFRRVRGDETARRMWALAGLREAQDVDEEEGETFAMPTNEYWSVDERFEESLKRTAGGPVEAFTAAGRDGAVLWVEARAVHKLLEPPVWEVVGS